MRESAGKKDLRCPGSIFPEYPFPVFKMKSVVIVSFCKILKGAGLDKFSLLQ
jgi:hypothetical protein